MDFLNYFFRLLFLTIIVLNIKEAVRKLITSKKVGLFKAYIEPISAFLFSAIGIAAIATSVNRFSTAKDYRDRAQSYERILSADGSDNYQHGSSSDSRAKYEENIKQLRANAKTMSNFAWYMVLLGANSLTLIFVSIWYFTEEGIVSNQFKIPEPVTAVLQNGKIKVSIAADQKKNKAVWSFKKTPQNLAIFGRFIEWDETEAAGQDVPPPDNINMPT